MSKIGKLSQGDQPALHILSAGMEALDLLNIGVIVTNGHRRLLFANQTAEQILMERDGLEVAAQGIFGPVDRLSWPSFAAGMQRAATGLTGAQKDIILALRRSSGKRPLTALVRSVTSRSVPANSEHPSVLVFIWDPEFPIREVDAGLRELFGLTHAEARVAKLLMEGKAVEECCTQLDVQASTVRMHLKNLFEKTGVQRQGQLISLLWKSVAMIRSKHEVSLFTAVSDRNFYSPSDSRIGSPTSD